MLLSAQRVEEILRDSLYVDLPDPVPADAVLVDGIMNKFGFDPVRLERHRNEIIMLLSMLSVEFQQETGGGMSFLNAAQDRDGNLWGQHRSMDQLFALGQAIGRVKCLFPREFWSKLPGSMPYYVVLEHDAESARVS